MLPWLFVSSFSWKVWRSNVEVSQLRRAGEHRNDDFQKKMMALTTVVTVQEDIAWNRGAINQLLR